MAVFMEKSATRHRSEYPKVLEFANENRKHGYFVDVTVLVGSFKLPANKLVLSCCSKRFEKMFKSERRHEETISVSAVDGESVKTLIDFMYSGVININNENVLQLLAAADYLQMDNVKEFCAEFLESFVSSASYITILDVANLHRLETLQKRIYQTISTEFDEFVQTENFRSLSKTELKCCISNIERAQVNEVSVYQAIIAWIKCKEQTRAENFCELFKMIHLEKLPRQFLKFNVFAERLVFGNPDCANLVMASLFTRLDIETKAKDASKILSIGGYETPGKVIEVFNCDGKEPTNYPDLVEDTCLGWALKYRDHIYYIYDSIRDRNNRLVKKDGILQIKINSNILAAINLASSMNTSRAFAAAAVYCDALIVSGGENAFQTKLSTAECYLPELKKWKYIASTNIAKRCNVLVTCEGCLYDIGGESASNLLSAVERLDGLEKKWEMVQPMFTPREGHAAVAYNGQIYAIGGGSNPLMRRLKSVEKYDPSSNKWTFVKEMNFTREGHVACVLRDKIYVVGGIDAQDQYVREIECYDPDKDTWSITGVTPVDLFNHALVVV